MVLYPYQDGIPKHIAEHCPSGWGIGLSDKGWMTTESFYEYITNVFFPWLVKEGVEFPVVVLLDNHSSHITLPLVRFCRENEIGIIGIVENSTHAVGYFLLSRFKGKLERNCS